MTDRIIFKEDLNKKKSLLGWLGFGKKNSSSAASAPLVNAQPATPTPSPFASAPNGQLPIQAYQNVSPSMAKPAYSPITPADSTPASFTDPASHSASLIGVGPSQPYPSSAAPYVPPVAARPVAEPVVQPTLAPQPEPMRTPTPTPVPQPIPEPEPASTPAPQPPSVPEITPEPQPTPVPEYAPAPVRPFPDPVPDSAPTPPAPEPMPAPTPEPQLDAAPVQTFAPIDPSAFRQPSSAPERAVEPESAPVSQYRPFAADLADFQSAPSASIPGAAPQSSRFSGSAISETEAVYEKGIATLRDLIAPPAIRLTPNTIQIGEVASRTHFIVAYPKYLGTNWFSPIINMDAPMDIAFFIHPIDTRDIVKDLRRAATQVQSQINIEAEEGKIRDPVLESALQNIEELRDKLQQGTEKFFRFGLYMTIYAKDDSALNELSKTIEAILEAQLVFTKPAVLRMDQGFVATRPLAMDTLDIANNLNTSPLSTTFPFVSSDLSSNDGVLYGINRHNNSLVLFDRFKMENANMVVFAKSGAGKSYTIKLEVLRSMMFGTNVIIIDPENEYKHLCETVGGTFMSIALNSQAHLNPFDLPKVGKEDADDEGVLRSHIANLIGLLHLMLGAVTPEEDSILDRAIRETYAIRDITETTNYSVLTATSFPTMADLYEVLRNLEGAESLAARLERYTEGVFGGFLNNQTNISMDKQLIVFNIRDLENELRPIAMYVVLQYIWNEMRSDMRRRMVVVDEAWIMMQNEDAAAFLFGIAKRCRKYYTGLTTITQDIADFMSSRYGKPIVTNSSMQLLLKQSPASVDLIAETFYLTDHEKFLLLESNVGEGIFFAGTKHVAIKVIASYSEDQIITTDPRQLAEIDAAKKDFDEGK